MRQLDPQNLAQILGDVRAEGPDGLAASITGISYNSGEVRPGDAFFCVPGFVHDGHDFAAQAAERGAAALVVSRPVDAPVVPQVRVHDVRVALAVAASNWYGRPSESVPVIGVTGTNGKTTTTYLLDAILRSSGFTTGMIGTVETRVAGKAWTSGRTTPESADLQKLLAEMVSEGVDAVCMEVSSHAIDLHRVDAVSFRVGAFTNLSQDHLDYHHTMEEYWSVKRGWFTSGSISTPVVDIDDVFGAGLAVDTGAEWTVGLGETARVRGTGIRLSSTSCRFVLEAEGGSREVILPLAGEFNVSNALVAAGCALALDVDLGSVAKGLAEAPQVPGRLERVDRGQPFAVLVDYAHTPDGLEKAILAVRDVVPGRVITVFGCGGDRDQEKRPTMGEVASKLSDVAVITSDNPRSEDPVGIILQIEDGARRGSADIVVEVDRRHAISVALQRARPGDAVLIAGKGHEDYQIFADRTIHFDDRQVAAEELEALC